MYQPNLFAAERPSFDYREVERIRLDERSWVDYGPFLKGSDALFEQIRRERPWRQRTRRMFDQEVLEPRLTAPWRLGQPLEPAFLEALRQSLNERYGRDFDTIGFNYYRDGDDSVAWHRDHIPRAVREPIVVLVSLGEPRRLMLRPRGGGRSLAFPMGGGDLLVTGGLAQRDWEHAILKVVRAGPRISLAFRHGTPYRG
jgi:alkylated DNA repair dioxygenase AlkB